MPIRYRAKDGTWKDIDTSLVRVSSFGNIFYESKSAPSAVKIFSDTSGDEYIASIEYEENSDKLLKSYIELSDVINGKRQYSESFEYDSNGRLIKVINQEGRAYSFGYDGYGRFTSVIDPLGENIQVSYFLSGTVPQINTLTVLHTFLIILQMIRMLLRQKMFLLLMVL